MSLNLNQALCRERGSEVVCERGLIHIYSIMRVDFQMEQKSEIPHMKAIKPFTTQKSFTASGRNISTLAPDLEWSRAVYTHTSHIVIKYVILPYTIQL